MYGQQGAPTSIHWTFLSDLFWRQGSQLPLTLLLSPSKQNCKGNGKQFHKNSTALVHYYYNLEKQCAFGCCSCLPIMAGAKPGVHKLQLKPIHVPQALQDGETFMKWDENSLLRHHSFLSWDTILSFSLCVFETWRSLRRDGALDPVYSTRGGMRAAGAP
ncbi:hypothetical protein FHG87_020873 [Trinorchestia longiramus]|nr:hypothetical protein FHG87_020873 [Trinorchestia longiramus]